MNAFDVSNAQQARVWSPLFVSFTLAMALAAILFIGWRVLGLPFAPFDAFDWLTRVLPGHIIAFGIGAMVRTIGALSLGPTAKTAKAAEQTMAIAGLIATATIGGAVLCWILRQSHGRHRVASGIGLGVLLGVPAMLISVQASDTATVGLAARAIWLLGAFLGWGAILGWAEGQLVRSADNTGGVTLHVERIDRRRFLVKLGGATAAITVFGAVVGELTEMRTGEVALMPIGDSHQWSTTHSLPNAKAAIKPAPGTRPEFTPLESHYRIDINTVPPVINEKQWRLKIAGVVEKPLALTLADLHRYDPIHQFVTLSCISNPVGGDLTGTTRWTGVSLQTLLPEWGLEPAATHLKIHSADQFYEVVSIDAIKADERIMLTYAWDGLPLAPEHGFPLRMYIPDVHGMKQPKWIESIEAIDNWEPGYWVKRGWSRVAQMHATSVIDTVSVDMTIIGADNRKLIPIGGIAHAGARGISKVEVRVDDGAWEEAALRTPLSPLTWVIWRYDWPFDAGKHTFVVRCSDGNGTAQIETPSPAEPEEATGLHSRSLML